LYFIFYFENNLLSRGQVVFASTVVKANAGFFSYLGYKPRIINVNSQRAYFF